VVNTEAILEAMYMLFLKRCLECHRQKRKVSQTPSEEQTQTETPGAKSSTNKQDRGTMTQKRLKMGKMGRGKMQRLEGNKIP